MNWEDAKAYMAAPGEGFVARPGQAKIFLADYGRAYHDEAGNTFKPTKADRAAQDWFVVRDEDQQDDGPEWCVECGYNNDDKWCRECGRGRPY